MSLRVDGEAISSTLMRLLRAAGFEIKICQTVFRICNPFQTSL